MAKPPCDAATQEMHRWLAAALDVSDLSAVVPEGDPLRVWWDPNAPMPVQSLIEVVSGSADTLTLFALVQRARLKSSLPMHPAVEEMLARRANDAARAYRNRSYPAGHHAFLSYSHRDMERAVAIVEILAGLGIRVFQDVRDIPAGASIAGALHAQMESASRALLLVTEDYAQSAWAAREIAHLSHARENRRVTLLPVLLDDVPLPDLIADIFTIDLRGFRGMQDRSWAEERLRKLTDVFSTRHEL